MVGPNETAPSDDFYAAKEGVQARQPDNHTAFRQAERRFKSKQYQPKDDDLPVLDPHDFSDERLVPRGMYRDAPIYDVKGIPGFMVIPGAVGAEEQEYWLNECFTNFMTPPNQTNLDALYEMPPQSLWSLLDQEIVLTKKSDQTVEKFHGRQLFRRIRWTTLGHQYNWTTKEYDFDKEPVPFPENLSKWCAEFSHALGFTEPFKAEAGIVNYYQLGDTLTGHVDRSEKNMDAPLLSLSFGLSCIFLIGGADRDDPVTPILVRSGDVTVLSGPSRLFFHGVPLIIPDTLPEHLECIQMIKDARINLNIRQVF